MRLGVWPLRGCTPFEMLIPAGELVGTVSVGIKEDNVVLVQDYTMSACQLKAPTLLGGAKSKTPALNREYLRLARPSAELQRWLLTTLGPRQNRAHAQAVGGPPPRRQ